MEIILGIIAGIFLLAVAINWGYQFIFYGFNIYGFTQIYGGHWFYGVVLVAIFLFVLYKGINIFVYILLALAAINVFSILIVIIKSNFELIPIFCLNILILYTFYQDFLRVKLKQFFEIQYGMTYDKASSKIAKEKLIEFGTRVIAAHYLNVFSFMLKPFTDEFGHKMFDSTSLREGVAIVDDYVTSNNYPAISFFGYIIILILYYAFDLNIFFELSYVYSVDFIIGVL